MISPARDNPIFRFKAAWWGLGVLLLFAVAVLLVRFGLPQPGPSLEELAAAKRYAVHAEVMAAQQANLAWKELEPGKTVQAPPREVFAEVGRRLLAAKPAAVETPGQAVGGAAAPAPAAPAPPAGSTPAAQP
jgi:hypothetical protein